MIKFFEKVDIKKISQCPVCQSYLYILPINMSSKISKYLNSIDTLKYDLETQKIIFIDSDNLNITGTVGKTSLRIKYKKYTAEYKKLIEYQLAAYLSEEFGEEFGLD